MIGFGLVGQILMAVCTAAGVSFLQKPVSQSLSLWFGVGLAAVSAYHMYRTLDRALDLGDAAPGLVFRGYLLRYVLFALILLMLSVTGFFNPLIVFFGYMALKVSALLQPFTHKLSNRFFGEEDPVPEPLPEEMEEETE